MGPAAAAETSTLPWVPRMYDFLTLPMTDVNALNMNDYLHMLMIMILEGLKDMMGRLKPDIQIPFSYTSNWKEGVNQMMLALDITNCLFPETMEFMVRVAENTFQRADTEINWKDEPFITILKFLHNQARVVRPDSNETFHPILWCGDKP